METQDKAMWVAACAHQLQRRWRTIPPEQLEEVAAELAADSALWMMTPAEAAETWLQPVAGQGDGYAGAASNTSTGASRRSA